MQVDRSFNVASPSTSSASSSQQHAKNSIIPSLLQQTQQQRVHDRIHGSIKTDQRRQGLCSRPASELSFAELPRHGAVVRQQLQRLKDEVALLQLMQVEAMKERDRIVNESRDFRGIAREQDEMLQLFVQHHSSLLHVSKHAPDRIGFTGAFETQRLQPQLQSAPDRYDEDLDVDAHFDQSTESEDDDELQDT